jgi:acyl-coenzyme A thioesterase PaaI-like protein
VTSKTLLATLFIRYFGLRKIPMLWFIQPKVVEMSDERAVIAVPLTRRTKNHLGSMYFAALAAGADLAGGFTAMAEIRRSGEAVSLVFKDMKADFLKRAEGEAHFVCRDVRATRELVQRAISTGARVDMPVHVDVLVPRKLGDEPVAKFVLTLSLKKKN